MTKISKITIKNSKKLEKQKLHKYTVKQENKILRLSNYLERLQERNKNTEHINYKLYHILCDPFTYVNASSKISKNPGALTKGIKDDEEIMRFFQKSNAEKISNKFKKQNDSWKPTRRTWIPKPGKNKLRPIDTPTQEDRIVQEAIRGILESIYEPEFREFENHNNSTSTNYGFRPNKSTWNAVENLKIKGQATTYGIEGDISGAYNNVDHDILISLLTHRIKDKKFLKVISELLKSGVMEKDKHIHTIKGTPQGGIVSPLLFNIYMFELDKHIYNQYIQPLENQNQTKTRKRNPEYVKIGYEIRKTRNQQTHNKNERLEKLKNLKILIKSRNKIPSYIIDTLPRKAIFSRYADDWVLLITSTKEEAIKIKEEIAE